MDASIQLLPWDSEFFGVKTARLHLLGNRDASTIVKQAYQEGYQLCYAFCRQPLAPEILELYQGQDVGGQITFTKTLHGGSAPGALPSWLSRSEQDKPSRALLHLAYLSGHLSRFRVDTRLPPGSFERLYRQWLINSLSLSSSSVYILGPATNPEGMISAEWDRQRCCIGLLAVRADKQGAGLAQNLLQAIEQESLQRGATTVIVKTQMVNGRACRFYRRCGYTQTKSEHLYHFHG